MKSACALPLAPAWPCRTPQGVRGLKYRVLVFMVHFWQCRTPQGVRGLKYLFILCEHGAKIVAPRQGCVD